MNFILFFFFKQKTAYEIKECDWSSDVCSSDLSIATWSRIEKEDGTHDVMLRAALPDEPTTSVDSLRDELLELGEHGATIRIRRLRPPTRHLIFAADDVPGYGWRTFTVEDEPGPMTAVKIGRAHV